MRPIRGTTTISPACDCSAAASTPWRGFCVPRIVSTLAAKSRAGRRVPRQRWRRPVPFAPLADFRSGARERESPGACNRARLDRGADRRHVPPGARRQNRRPNRPLPLRLSSSPPMAAGRHCDRGDRLRRVVPLVIRPHRWTAHSRRSGYAVNLSNVVLIQCNYPVAPPRR